MTSLSRRELLLGGTAAIAAASPVAALADACVAPEEVFAPTDQDVRMGAEPIYRMALDIENLDPASPQLAQLSDEGLAELETQITAYIEANHELAQGDLGVGRIYNTHAANLAAGNPFLGESPDLFQPNRDTRNIGAFGVVLQRAAQAQLDIVAHNSGKPEAEHIAEVDREVVQDALATVRGDLLETVGAKFEEVRALRADPSYTACTVEEAPPPVELEAVEDPLRTPTANDLLP